MQKRQLWLAGGLLVLLLAGGMAAAAGDRGAEVMVLEGGRRGSVPFDHHRHQAAAGECDTCHVVFPREAGGIERLKAAGELKARSDVMNKLCINCHRAAKTAGGAAGPVTCGACHRR